MAERVLIIDDSADIHDLLKVRLRPEGLSLLEAKSAEEGLALAAEALPDLILLDVDMPAMSGFEVCRRLKEDSATASIPVIFLSAATEVYAKVEGFDVGGIDYVTKPFEPAELRARVRAALRTKRYQDLLSSRAQIDALTSLWNRAYFDRRLADEVAAVKRYGRVISLVLIDVDHFKSINDRFGHPFGDQVLQRLGEILWISLRTADAPCRYGGEEFAAILTETDLSGALKVAERIKTKLSAHEFVQRASLVNVTASFGVASSEQLADPTAVTLESLIVSADEALYEAKHNGRDQVRVARVS